MRAANIPCSGIIASVFMSALIISLAECLSSKQSRRNAQNMRLEYVSKICLYLRVCHCSVYRFQEVSLGDKILATLKARKIRPHPDSSSVAVGLLVSVLLCFAVPIHKDHKEIVVNYRPYWSVCQSVCECIVRKLVGVPIL